MQNFSYLRAGSGLHPTVFAGQRPQCTQKTETGTSSMHLVSVPTKPKPTPAQIASSITRDTGSDPCWGWFGSGAETTMHCDYRIKIVFCISAELVKVLHECTLQWSSVTTVAS